MASTSLTNYGTLATGVRLAEAPQAGADTFGPGDTSPGNAPALGWGPCEGQTFGPYRIVRLLGEGGMGRVFEAVDQRLQRPVALKVMRAELAADTLARERFLREARAVAAVRNEHVITVYEVDQAGETPYIAMELLRGQTLDAWLRAGKTPRVEDILRIGRDIATGLAAAHECGLVHRDVKPANLWLEAGRGRVKLLDFGLARPMDRDAALTGAGQMVGTPFFMSPEQAAGASVDGRSDLFSLGVVLYRLCTGQYPFRGSNITAVLLAITTQTPPSIQECNPAVPAALADLIGRLLEKEPGDRPRSASAVAEALATLSAETSTCRPEHVVQQPIQKAASHTTRPASNQRRPWLTTLRQSLTRYAAIGAPMIVVFAVAAWWCFHRPPAATTEAEALTNSAAAATATPLSGPPIRLGVVYSRTGTLAISERPILDGVLLAVDEINDQGGVLGRPVVTVIEDGQSNENVFRQKAAKLIGKDHVAALVGCYTSACRKAVKAIVEQQDHLLLYPVSYEGMERSVYVVYGGSVPNQQIVPALQWCYGFLNKKRWYLVGLDSLFPRAAHAVIRDEAHRLGCEVVGEEFLPPGSTECADVARRIREAHADLIVNTISGDTNIALFRSLRRAGVSASTTPVLSFRMTEIELASLSRDAIVGQYAAGNYFQTLDVPENRAFLDRVRARFGPDRVVTDPMQTAYDLVHLWAQAVRTAGTEDTAAVRVAIKGQRFDSPQGPVTIDPTTLHTLQVTRIGQVDATGHFQEVFVSPRPISPQPFPASRSPQAWHELLQQLHQRWGGHWENQGSGAQTRSDRIRNVSHG